MYNNIPEWLRPDTATVYCTHKNKVPTHGTRPNQLHTFHSFNQALALIEPGEGLGVGLWGALCGVDIDHCITNNTISPDAQAIIDFFPEAYIEKSLSGTGVHILFLAPTQYSDKTLYYTKLGKKHTQPYSFDGLEFYQGLTDHRYFTLTGDAIQVPPNREDVTQDKIITFLDTYFKRPPAPAHSPISLSKDDDEDRAWLRWALTELGPTKLISCWFKTPTGSGGTESEDDLIFMSELAFYSNNNPALMRRAFEGSPYYLAKDAKHKNKWARVDYSEGVINKALQPNTAREYFTDYHYNGTHIVKGDDIDMIAPKISTRVSQRGENLTVIDTKTFKFEVSEPVLKKNTTTGEKTVKWVSCYKKGSDEPSVFLDRKDPAFELAAGIALDRN